MADDPEPPRKYYDLKPRDFERVNPSAVPGPQFHPAEPQAPAPVSPRIDLKDIYRDARMPGDVLEPGRRPAADAQVAAMLKENHRREAAAGLYDVAYRPPRRSRRTRDFVMIVVGTLIFFGGLAIYGMATRNAVLFVYSVAGLGIMIAGSWWVMYQVMDKY